MKRIVLTVLLLSFALSASGCALRDTLENARERIFPTEEKQTSEEKELTEKPNVINMGVYDLDTFNPLTTKSRSVSEAMQLVYEPLFTVDDEMRTQPVLAKDFNVSADGKTININLKEGVTWHDGTPFTAQDVAYTFKSILNGETEYSLQDVADYSVTGDYSLSIALKRSVPRYEATLTFPIVQYRTDMKSGTEYVPNGTGPFCYGSKASVDKLYFGAFDAYRDGRAKIDALYIHLLPSSEEYLTMLEASEIDFASDKTVDLTTYMPKANLELYGFSSNNLVYLGFNLENKLLSGANTRKGISELIDKTDMVETAVFSRGTAVGVPINPDSSLYYTLESSFESDKLTADDFLGNDGWGPNADGQYERVVNGEAQVLQVKILANADDADATASAGNAAEDLNNFNIKAEVEAVGAEEYAKRVAAKDYELLIGEADVGNNGDLSQLTAVSSNPFGYNNESVDTLTAQLGMTRNEDEEKELIKQCCEMILNDMPFLPLYFEKGSVLSTSNVVSGVDPTTTFLYKNSAAWSVRE